MGRKASIIRRVEMMGYSVTHDNGMCLVALQNGSGKIFMTLVSDEDLMYKDFVIEETIGAINDLITRDF